MRNVTNPARHPELDRWIAECEGELRARFHGSDRAALKALPPIQAYTAYYKRYKKTYHVQLQLESVALRGRAIPRSPALVAAMVAVELKNLLLTAGHDLEAVQPPVTLTVATGSERYRLLSGQEQGLQAGDMMMADGQGVISSVLCGPDHRTRIAPETRQVFFAVYALTPVATNVCVESTIRDAYFRDFDILVVEDCVACSFPDLHRATLKNVEVYFGQVTTLKELEKLSAEARVRQR